MRGRDSENARLFETFGINCKRAVGHFGMSCWSMCSFAPFRWMWAERKLKINVFPKNFFV